jgi:hypothetical protein
MSNFCSKIRKIEIFVVLGNFLKFDSTKIYYLSWELIRLTLNGYFDSFFSSDGRKTKTMKICRVNFPTFEDYHTPPLVHLSTIRRGKDEDLRWR